MQDTRLLDSMATIRQAAREMAANKRFTLVFEEYKPLGGRDIDYWEERVGTALQQPDYAIPESLRRIYAVTGGFRFQWQYLPGPGGPISGSSQLVTLIDVYQRDDESDVPMADLYRRKRRFDEIGGDELVCLEFPEAPDGELRLVHVDEEERKTARLNLGPIEYIVRMAEFRAIHGWQSLFASDGPPDRSAIEVLTNRVDSIFGSAGIE